MSADGLPRLGVVAVGRTTFDLELARRNVAHAVLVLAELHPGLVGNAEPITDADAVAEAVGPWAHDVDLVVVLHATFTDSSFVAAVREATDADLLLWAFPETRTGGRLSLNSLCGLNLASYRLARDDRPCRFVYTDPAAPDALDELRTAIEQPPRPRPVIPSPEAPPPAGTLRTLADRVAEELTRTRLGVVGTPPTGFEPCAVDDDELRARLGVEVVHESMDDLFRRARGADATAVELIRRRTGRALDGLDDLPADEVDPSLRLAAGLAEVSVERELDAVAARCWPECFEGHHGALCTPLALLAEGGRPGGCEADALGTVSLLVMQWLGEEPAFLADLVDLDRNDDTGVFWHCGVAPWTMAGEPARASRHPNREVPLTHEFALAPGPVTIARLSSSRGLLRLVLGRGEILDRPLPYRGTAGVVRFDVPVDDVLATVVTEGLEHHYCLGRGDHIAGLRAVAARLELPVVPLGGG